MNILLVDDSKTMRNLQRRTLETLGPSTFSEAGDGEEALAIIAAATAPFDFILVDWNMPVMNGLDFLRALRKSPGGIQGFVVEVLLAVRRQLGLGAEVGVSTTKMHWYGPMGLEGLTTQKFIAYGEGTIVE